MNKDSENGEYEEIILVSWCREEKERVSWCRSLCFFFFFEFWGKEYTNGGSSRYKGSSYSFLSTVRFGLRMGFILCVRVHCSNTSLKSDVATEEYSSALWPFSYNFGFQMICTSTKRRSNLKHRSNITNVDQTK